MGLEISTRQSGDITILDLRGRSTIDGGESELLSDYLRKSLAKDARTLLLHLAVLTQIDSSGVSVRIET
jgi:anti-anti-sigma factor